MKKCRRKKFLARDVLFVRGNYFTREYALTRSCFIKKVFSRIEGVYRFPLVVLISSLEEFLLPAHPAGEKISPVETVYVGSGRIRGIHLRRTDRVTFDSPTATQG